MDDTNESPIPFTLGYLHRGTPHMSQMLTGPTCACVVQTHHDPFDAHHPFRTLEP